MLLSAKKLLWTLTLLSGLLAAAPTQAQHARVKRRFDGQGRVYYRGPLHLTLGVGTAFYNGDLGSGVGNNFLGPALNAGVVYRLHPHWAVGSEAGYLYLGSRDQLPERGLAFRSHNALGTAFLRYDLLGDAASFNRLHHDSRPFQMFVQAGLGLLLYSPRAYVGDRRPTGSTLYLPTERNDYPALAGVAPVGAGFSLRLSDELRANVEGAYYFTTTDHLDDISRRGNASQNDGFGVLQLKLEYAL